MEIPIADFPRAHAENGHERHDDRRGAPMRSRPIAEQPPTAQQPQGRLPGKLTEEEGKEMPKLAEHGSSAGENISALDSNTEPPGAIFQRSGKKFAAALLVRSEVFHR